jgi:uncharacterized phiE125 gp8 family phage protein
MNARRVTVPTAEPIGLEAMRGHLRITDHASDTDIADALADARNYAESYTERALLTQTWQATAEDWPELIRLPMPPLQSVEEVSYTDADGNRQTLDPSAYQVDTSTEPGTIRPAYGTTWPTLRPGPCAVAVRYVCGWASADDIPRDILRAVRMQAAHYFRHRGDDDQAARDVQLSVNTLLDPYRMGGF